MMTVQTSSPVSDVSETTAAVTSVPMLDLTRQRAQIGPAMDEAVLRVMASGQFILGPELDAFEREAAEWLGAAHAIGVASGTDALYLALMALGIGVGDEVITTSMSYIATSEAIARTGAKPVFVDVDADTFNLDMDAVLGAITPATRCLLPVHLFGRAVDMTALMDLAKRHELFVIEDCAQAMGARWDGQQVGTFGDFGCYSFFPTKNLGAHGDGGLVTARTSELAEKIRVLRLHGQTRRYHHEVHGGINSRLDAMQAAILRVKLPCLNDWNAARRERAHWYNDALAGLPGVVTPQVPTPEERHVFHQYTLRITPQARLTRDAVQQALADQQIASMIYYPVPLHRQGIHQDLHYPPSALPNAELVAQEVLSLPIYPELTRAEVNHVAGVLRSLLQA
jgi:dTDP-4-amino-4,6-dideoxygalactose transaminase